MLAMRPPGFSVAAFVRQSSVRGGIPADVAIRHGDLDDPASLLRALQGVDVLLNLASLGFGHAPGIVQAARGARLRRCVFVGTTAVFTTLPAKTKAVREAAETSIFSSGLPFTLLRPTMIYGRRGDRNMERLIRFLRWTPAVPLVEGGKALQQPVHVDDVASAVWLSIEPGTTAGRAFNIGGREPVTMAEIVGTAASLLGRKVATLDISLRTAQVLAKSARAFPGLPHLSQEQILRLLEDKVVDNSSARAAFGYSPVGLEDGLRRLLVELGLS